MVSGLRVVFTFVREVVLHPTEDSLIDLHTGRVLARGKSPLVPAGDVGDRAAEDTTRRGQFCFGAGAWRDGPCSRSISSSSSSPSPSSSFYSSSWLSSPISQERPPRTCGSSLPWSAAGLAAC